MKDILKNIREKRVELNYSQEYMADELDMTQAAYSNWEKGARELTYNNLLRIADVFGCSVIDIITYPDKYEKVDGEDTKPDPVEAVLQIKLTKEKKEQVFKLVFGDNNIDLF